jgi:hypothetical protein
MIGDNKAADGKRTNPAAQHDLYLAHETVRAQGTTLTHLETQRITIRRRPFVENGLPRPPADL